MTKEYRCRSGRGIATVLLVVLSASIGQAVTSKVTRQSSSKDLLAGESDGVVVTSRGTIQLGRAAKVLSSDFDEVWSVNSIVVSGGTIFIGTSPNGHVYKYSLGKLTKIYPPQEEDAAAQSSAGRGQAPGAESRRTEERGGPGRQRRQGRRGFR